jgi:hypothetical protein
MREVIAVQQTFELHGEVAQAQSLSGRPPLAPLPDAIVEKQPPDDGDEIGAELTAPVKLSEDAVVVFDQFETSERGELVAIRP